MKAFNIITKLLLTLIYLEELTEPLESISVQISNLIINQIRSH